VRGKPETFNRPDYNFRLEGVRAGEPLGDETVAITERRRGSALDLIVSEAMILANSHWGGLLAECGVPGIYRSQASLAPGVKVRMGTKAQPHAATNSNTIRTRLCVIFDTPSFYESILTVTPERQRS